jgi:PAS domain S-box-containing protein
VLSRTLRVPWWLQAGVAVLSAVIAFGLTLLLQLHERPLLLPMIAVLVTAMRGGFGAGVLCGIVTLLLANYFIIPPIGRFAIPSLTDAYELGIFALTAAVISMVAARRRKAQLTLEATLGSIGDGVIVTDRAGRVTFLNSVAEALTGWPLDEAVGAPMNDVFKILHEESRAPVPNPAERALREGGVVGLANHTTLIARDGTERPIADSGAPIRGQAGGILGAVIVFRDASTHRAAEDLLTRQAVERQELLERERNARADSDRANRLKDEFLATLSHELRTPLNAVLGWSHMLTRRQLTAEQQKQALAAIYRNAQAQARLVDDVLDLSRIVTGRMALTAEAVDLSEVVRTSAESFAPAVHGKRHDLRLDLETGAEITGDSHRLRQIVWNLLSNATKFTPEGGVISCRVATAGERVELVVSDTGQGIEPAFLPYVFDRFRQGDSSTTRGHGGLGLGLALVRHLVEAHGGTVYAASAGIGKGTTVVVRFPARSATPFATPQTAGEASDRRVLVAEGDDPRARDV